MGLRVFVVGVSPFGISGPLGPLGSPHFSLSLNYSSQSRQNGFEFLVSVGGAPITFDIVLRGYTLKHLWYARVLHHPMAKVLSDLSSLESYKEVSKRNYLGAYGYARNSGPPEVAKVLRWQRSSGHAASERDARMQRSSARARLVEYNTVRRTHHETMRSKSQILSF